jgi:hypothetical protein
MWTLSFDCERVLNREIQLDFRRRTCLKEKKIMSREETHHDKLMFVGVDVVTQNSNTDQDVRESVDTRGSRPRAV